MNNYFTIILFIYSALNPIDTLEISSKIDFNSEDVPNSDSSTDKSDPVVIVVENSNIEAHNKETRNFLSPNSRPRAGSNVSIRGPVKPIRSHSNYPNNLHPARPKVIKNIYVIINGKAKTQPENFVCKDGVCRTTLATDIDEHGNVIGAVCITIVTKSEDSKIEDVPVIDGIHGTGLDDRPLLVFNNGRPSPNPPFFDNNIPQTPLHRSNPGPRRNHFRPQSASFYPRNFGPRKETTLWSPWNPSRGTVDDKIEAPLSQTKPSD